MSSQHPWVTPKSPDHSIIWRHAGRLASPRHAEGTRSVEHAAATSLVVMLLEERKLDPCVSLKIMANSWYRTDDYAEGR